MGHRMRITHSLWTLPNVFTISRLFLLIPILWSMSESRPVLLCVFACFAILIDSLDGYLARRLNQKSDFGRILDPVVDKMSVLGVIVFMLVSPQYEFPLWFFLFLLVRELAVLACSFYIIVKHKPIMESKRSGKVSAFVTGSAVFLFALKFQSFGWILLWIASALTLFSSGDYFYSFLKNTRDE
jgi:CDP-diacylglycerol--glycerol-3-phosphate 3-phosphatidyltransferase